MPMLHEDDSGRARSGAAGSQHADSAPIPIQARPGRGAWLNRRLSEESIRTELCEGPIPDSRPKLLPSPQRDVSDVSRAELIERLKKGDVHVQVHHHDSQCQRSQIWPAGQHPQRLFPQRKMSSPPRTPQSEGEAPPGLLPAPTITPERQKPSHGKQAIIDPFQEDGVSIGPPRSALHSGNFTPVMSPGTADAENPSNPPCAGGQGHLRSGPAGWMSTSPPRDYTPYHLVKETASYRREAFRSCSPSSLSSSLSSSFVYKPPTSPLVQSETNEQLDMTLPLNGSRNPRRHTLNLFHSPLANATATLRTHPYQAHQPRRSLNSTPNFSTGTSPQTPAVFGPRRPSLGSEASPLHHASMVGSYEESILRGRMSTTPSKPLEFLAQIGVLGLGKCKASLRCPRHLTLPFSAVFYSYADSSKGTEDGPSPYVGQIDLERGLPSLEDGQRSRKKLQSRAQARNGVGEADAAAAAHGPSVDLSDGEGGPRPTTSKRRSRSPKAPPGGGYRIPEKGQLQIIIKNQNKTAVKLFLVPYDLAGMEPGTKTFIRQRSYSAGPVIEADIPGTRDAPTTAADRPILRYLIHLHICCLSKGRYYLYKFIRVVFANRVPDDKEKLRNEVTYPEPRFTPYKPGRVLHRPPAPNNPHPAAAASSLPPSAPFAADRDFRRRSAGVSISQGYPAHPYHHHFLQSHIALAAPFGISTSIDQRAEPEPEAEEEVPKCEEEDKNSTATPPPMPMAMPGVEMTGRSTITHPITTTTTSTTTGSWYRCRDSRAPPLHANSSPNKPREPSFPSPTQTITATTTPTTTMNALSDYGNTSLGAYDKLSKGYVGYGGSADGRRPSAEGLLSKRLRSLGVVQQQQQPSGPGLGEWEDCLPMEPTD
ncbi:uncharacterized protein B0T15DRAFT_484219 [Chaetomium strumarium]|uniref:Atos-like conserved domain-containing protein n=1 Tax=Chaetomium strumarium TaxID=1170767 RepID=A0AAJ0M341_9PEZI|nr:hypothetical protein B0T15DRAFT_484219 [Chaetomium strumarium]